MAEGTQQDCIYGVRQYTTARMRKFICARRRDAVKAQFRKFCKLVQNSVTLHCFRRNFADQRSSTIWHQSPQALTAHFLCCERPCSLRISCPRKLKADKNVTTAQLKWPQWLEWPWLKCLSAEAERHVVVERIYRRKWLQRKQLGHKSAHVTCQQNF